MGEPRGKAFYIPVRQYIFQLKVSGSASEKVYRHHAKFHFPDTHCPTEASSQLKTYSCIFTCMLTYVLVLFALLWLRRLWVTRHSRKLVSKEPAVSSGSECEADLLESGLSVELKGRKRVHLTSEVKELPQHASIASVGESASACRFPDTVFCAPCPQPILKSISARPMSPTQLLTVTKALQMELQLTAGSRPKQLHQHRKSATRPFIGSVAARRAKTRDHFTAAETSLWQPPVLATESPLFPTSHFSKQSVSTRSRPKRLHLPAPEMFSAHLVNEIDTEDDVWAKNGRNPSTDPRWWTIGVVRAVSRKDLTNYFNQQEVMPLCHLFLAKHDWKILIFNQNQIFLFLNF